MPPRPRRDARSPRTRGSYARPLSVMTTIMPGRRG
jgi:hypothetical protein